MHKEGVINYEYDSLGRRIKTYTAHSETQYGYDALSRLKTVTVTKRNGQVLAEPEVTTYNYTSVGSRESTALPNGITTSYQYNNLNRLTSLSSVLSVSSVVSSYSYSLAPDDRRTGVTEIMRSSSGPLFTG